MAFYARKTGLDLWNKKKTNSAYCFCLCCKSEIEPGKAAATGINNKLLSIYNSYLCELCLKQWAGLGRLCEIKRFKK